MSEWQIEGLDGAYPAGCSTPISGRRTGSPWYCSCHVPWGNETLHVALVAPLVAPGNSSAIYHVIAAWFANEEDQSFEGELANTPRDSNGVPWGKVEQWLESVRPTVSEQEFEESGEKLKLLLNDLKRQAGT